MFDYFISAIEGMAISIADNIGNKIKTTPDQKIKGVKRKNSYRWRRFLKRQRKNR
jgi:hypothetical protein